MILFQPAPRDIKCSLCRQVIRGGTEKVTFKNHSKTYASQHVYCYLDDMADKFITHRWDEKYGTHFAFDANKAKTASYNHNNDDYKQYS